jgi:hypothetical protein
LKKKRELDKIAQKKVKIAKEKVIFCNVPRSESENDEKNKFLNNV